MKKSRIHNILQLHTDSKVNERGFTVIEAVVSIALIAILSLVVYSLFFSTSRILKYSEEQVKRSAVIRVIKENVATSVRNNNYIYGTSKKALGITRIENLPVIDLSGQEYPEYSFDLEYLGIGERNILRYKVSLEHNHDSANAFEFLIEVYKP